MAKKLVNLMMVVLLGMGLFASPAMALTDACWVKYDSCSGELSKGDIMFFNNDFGTDTKDLFLATDKTGSFDLSLDSGSEYKTYEINNTTKKFEIPADNSAVLEVSEGEINYSTK
ncbi:hypothetical protein BJP34_20240 [Moorena producens PAL-8-15-08-1]|uniref:Carboxypeptidase regulatory-like domain-containing protein n=1 Tax=Moorena producens PAL-8-15-08-1 TaxID=1458985 RepID=A0A1D8TUY2_9CYAN|nr:hypothetical protein [Moorena producens]AOX01461.1 hypothetical protein BJP34_20240 [Moorena producens PAL-8-15-08-1]